MLPEDTIADTSVLLNFLCIDRMDLIGNFPGTVRATNNVVTEIKRPENRRRFDVAVSAGYVVEHEAATPAEIEIFLGLQRAERLGVGELSAMAVALANGCRLAMDDARAIKRTLQLVGVSGSPPVVLRTRDIIGELIRQDVLTPTEADSIAAEWREHHTFEVQIPSFAEWLAESDGQDH